VIRIGHGYDAHALAGGRRLVIGGVDVPHPRGLAGHSDADVLLHAICDALLGSVAMGDIGAMFPDSDEAFRGADSRSLLKAVVGRLHDAGFSVVNVDATVIAQAPRLAPYVDSMRRNVAADCRVDVSRISIKATTTERMGFTGREEGIAAHAVALVESADS
jgi:2-C-methyl-D-erythritol 2,4-cyclodiphosphate synthase